MAQLAIAAVGALALGPVGLGLTTAGTGFMLGSLAYSMMAPGQKSYGPRLNDLKVTGTEYGAAIPWVAGSPRVAGQIIWASERRETATEEEQGKGGGPTYTSYTYDVDLLILLSENPIAGVARIWSNGELIYGDGVAREGLWVDMRVYTGADDQLPDPTYEAAVGLGNAPAYRGMGTVLIQGLQLGNGGSIPNLTFEIGQASVSPDESDFFYADFMQDTTDDFACVSRVQSFATQGGAPWSVSKAGLQLHLAGWDFGEYPARGVYYRWTNGLGFFSGTGAVMVDLVFSASTKPQGDSAHTAMANVFALSENPNGVGSSSGMVMFGYVNFDDAGKASSVSVNVWGSGVLSASVGAGDCRITVYMFADQAHVYVDSAYLGSKTLSGSLLTATTLLLGGQVQASDTTETQYASVIYKQARVLLGTAQEVIPMKRPACGAPVFDGKANPQPLREVVGALLSRSGYESEDFDVLDLGVLADKPVRALAIGQVGSSRSALEALQQAYFFECSATARIHLRPRTPAPVLTIPFADLGLASGSGGEEEPLSLTLGNDLELPAQLALSYPNMAGDYQAATEFSDRLLSGQQSTETIQTAVGLLPEEAKGIVDGLLMDKVASLAMTTLKVPLKYARLEPGDVINAVNNDGRTYRLRIQSKTDAMPIIELQCVLDDVGAIDSAAITDSGYVSSETVIQPAGTRFEVLDIPILRDADDAPGYYLAVAAQRASESDVWPGAVAAQAWDGVNYAQLLKTTAQSVMGTATTVLASWHGGAVFDETSTVTVQVSGELASSTREAMLLDESINALLLGSEIVRFRTAALLSAGTYLLSGLLRGQRGTEWAMSSHAAGERCVLLGNSLRRVASQTNELGVDRQIKAVTLGQFLSSGAAKDFTDTGVSLKPFSPANPRALADGGDLVVTWQRRTRRSYQYAGPAPVVPLGEASEAYRVRVLVGTAVLRSDAVSQMSYRYTADMQVVDGVTSGTALQFEICQLSATVGPGYPSTVGAKTP